MDLNHSFTVPASVADTWQTFEDIESVAECFPGAVVTEVAGDDFKGTCKVKLGPIAMVYSGSGTFLEKDEAALVGQPATDEAVRAAAASAADGTNPPSDLNGDADYRKHLATVLTRRAVLAAAGA